MVTSRSCTLEGLVVVQEGPTGVTYRGPMGPLEEGKPLKGICEKPEQPSISLRYPAWTKGKRI